MGEPGRDMAIRSSVLTMPGVAHAFFTRAGGVSDGVYASLNGGVGSRDDPNAVAENRRRMAAHLGVDPAHFLVPYQVHSADALVADGPWTADARPRVDALVTSVPGLALGVTGADCGIVLFAEPQAGVVGAAHAGWKGALSGVLEATLEAMIGLGARRDATTAVVGPTIAASSYEVGPEFVMRFRAVDAEYDRFFTAAGRETHAMFDLPGFIVARLRAAGLSQVQDLGLNTYADDARFFSYRRSVHRSEPDYGRLVAGIALASAR